jgi:hypothetical protein
VVVLVEAPVETVGIEVVRQELVVKVIMVAMAFNSVAIVVVEAVEKIVLVKVLVMAGLAPLFSYTVIFPVAEIIMALELVQQIQAEAGLERLVALPLMAGLEVVDLYQFVILGALKELLGAP